MVYSILSWNTENTFICGYGLSVNLSVYIIIADPDVTIAVSHTLEPDTNSGDYILTVYFSLQRHDPLLLASIVGFDINHFKVGNRGLPVDFDRVDVHTAENEVAYVTYVRSYSDQLKMKVVLE